MAIDGYQLRALARELATLYAQLDDLKGTRGTSGEVSSGSAHPGPRPPGNWLAVATAVECVQRLHEVAFNAFGDIGIKLHDDETRATTLCMKIAFNAFDIAALDWADDLTDELEHQARTIRRLVDPPEVATHLIRQAQSTNQLFTAAHAAKAATAATGKPITRKQITYWGHAGYITTHHDNHGKACYKLSEIVEYLQRNSC